MSDDHVKVLRDAGADARYFDWPRVELTGGQALAIADHLEAVTAERDRLRAALEAIAAIPPGGTTLLTAPTVAHLQTVARNALAQFDGSRVMGGAEGT